MKRKVHIVKIGDPHRTGFLKDLEGVFICSPDCEKYSIAMLQEDGVMRVRTLVIVTGCGSVGVQ